MAKAKLYSTVEMVALAQLAFKANGTVVRQTGYRQGKLRYCNRQLIQEHLKGNHSRLGEVTDEHRESAKEMILYLQQLAMLQTLKKGASNKFVTSLVELLHHDKIELSKAGLIAWIPRTVHDYTVRDHAREVSSRFEHSSKHLGQQHSKVVIDFTLIEKRFIKKLGYWAVTGCTNHNNLVFYWARSEDKIVESGRISAHIKQNVTDPHRNNAKISHLNYVKLVQGEEHELSGV